MSFPRFMIHVHHEEGGYSSSKHSPNDRGRETYRGISRMAWPHWIGWPVIDARNRAKRIKWNEVLPELEIDVDAFYKFNFWQRYNGPIVPHDTMLKYPAALAVIDWLINSGAGRRNVRRIQRLTDTPADGLYGPGTLAAIATEPAKEFGDRVCNRRLRFVEAIARNDPSQRRNLRVWRARIQGIKRGIGEA
jgi:lysozyme family protein